MNREELMEYLANRAWKELGEIRKEMELLTERVESLEFSRKVRTGGDEERSPGA